MDFVSRYFAPKVGVSEDPVTGSAHCALAPYWAERLGKNEMAARQLSKRGGTVFCEVRGDRVFLSGRAVTFLEREIDHTF
jgi:predicted PhzF superfamily epimerase YddE/YHI9